MLHDNASPNSCQRNDNVMIGPEPLSQHTRPPCSGWAGEKLRTAETKFAVSDITWSYPQSHSPQIKAQGHVPEAFIRVHLDGSELPSSNRLSISRRLQMPLIGSLPRSSLGITAEPVPPVASSKQWVHLSPLRGPPPVTALWLVIVPT